jgi:hypothetical protein
MLLAAVGTHCQLLLAERPDWVLKWLDLRDRWHR